MQTVRRLPLVINLGSLAGKERPVGFFPVFWSRARLCLTQWLFDKGVYAKTRSVFTVRQVSQRFVSAIVFGCRVVKSVINAPPNFLILHSSSHAISKFQKSVQPILLSMAGSARTRPPIVKVMEPPRHLLVTGPVRGHPTVVLVRWEIVSAQVTLDQNHMKKKEGKGKV